MCQSLLSFFSQLFSRARRGGRSDGSPGRRLYGTEGTDVTHAIDDGGARRVSRGGNRLGEDDVGESAVQFDVEWEPVFHGLANRASVLKRDL